MTVMRVFLSGDTRGEWQSVLMNRFPTHEFFDPRTLSEEPPSVMARKELEWIDQADIIFAYLNKENPYGFGTSFEIGYSVATRKAIIYVDEKQVSSSKWIAEHPVLAFDSLDAGVEKLAEMLEQGSGFIADMIVDSLLLQDFTILSRRELNDDLSTQVASRIYSYEPLYAQLMLASKTLPRRWYDWNLGYLLQRLDPRITAQCLERYPESFYQSEGIAWALGLAGNDDQRIIHFLQQQCERCEDFDAWWCAAHSLEQLHHGDAIEILKRTLVQPEWQNLDNCLKNLGSRPATIGILRRVTHGNIDRIVEACLDGLKTLSGRRLHNVIWLLERFRRRDHRIIDALMQLHSQRVTEGSSVAHRVVEALGQIAEPGTRPVLEKHLLEASYFRTRAWAARGLGLIGAPESVEPLKRALAQEKDPHVLSMITQAIYNIAEPDKRRDIDVMRKAQWLENGMIADETNKWYWSPEVYDEFSHAEDPHGISFEVATSLCTGHIQSAIDLGSGTGRFIEELKDRIPTLDKIYALDSSDEMISYLGRKFGAGMPHVEPLKAEIADIPLPDQSIDLAVSSWGFPSRIWDQDLAYTELREVYRVLREHAHLITIGWDEDFSDEMTIPLPIVKTENWDF
jgi:SAM-dependent methyltransferase